MLLAGGLLLYIGAVLRATLRVRRQYSRAMIGGGTLSFGATLAAAAQYLPILLIPLAGAILLYVVR